MFSKIKLVANGTLFDSLCKAVTDLQAVCVENGVACPPLDTQEIMNMVGVRINTAVFTKRTHEILMMCAFVSGERRRKSHCVRTVDSAA